MSSRASIWDARSSSGRRNVAPADTPDARGDRGLTVVGRLRADTTLDQARTQLTAIAARLARDFPATNRGTLAAPNEPRPMIALRHTRLAPGFRAEVGTIGAVIMAAVGLVLADRVRQRRQPAAVPRHRANPRDCGTPRAGRRPAPHRPAVDLGELASRRQRWRPRAAVLAVDRGRPAIVLPAEQARMLQTGVDGPAFAFALGISPAQRRFVRPRAGVARRPSIGAGGSSWRLRTRHRQPGQPWTAPRARGRSGCAGGGPARLRRTADSQSRPDAQRRSRLPHPRRSAGLGRSAAIGLHARISGTPYFAAVLERIAGAPGVAAVSFARALPMSGTERRGFRPEGYAPRRGEDMEFPFNIVDDRYFRTLQIPLVAGRDFDSRDRPGCAACGHRERRTGESLLRRPRCRPSSERLGPPRPRNRRRRAFEPPACDRRRPDAGGLLSARPEGSEPDDPHRPYRAKSGRPGRNHPSADG